jgi:hypothetical protein
MWSCLAIGIYAFWMEADRNTSLIQATIFNRNESRREGSLLGWKWMIDWWLNRWSHKAATNSVLQNGPRWQILKGQRSLARPVLVRFAKSVTDGAFCGVTSRLPAFKSHRNTLTGSFPFTAEFYLKNRAARVGESSPQFYEDERAREEPWVSQTPPKC